MSISSTNSRNNYTGNNSTDTYNYTFRILDQDDLLVTVRDLSDVETTLAITTDYTVTGVGSLSGGTIVLTGGNLATGYILSIRRVVPLVQETDIRNQGAFYPEIHEDQFDRQVMMAQQQQDEVDRSVKLAETIDPNDFDTRLPASIVGSVNQTVMTNATGDGFEPGPTANEVANAQSYATAAGASATAAAASETAAALSASQAAASASASQWNDVQYLTSASSPFTVTDLMAGTLFEVDASGGAVTINLPAISGLTLGGAWSIGIKKTDSSSNAVTAVRNGTDTIDGATSKATSRQYGGFVLVPDIDPSPDKWTSISFGEVPIAGAIVGTTDSQTLTNKTLTSPTVNTPSISAPSITSQATFTDQSTPSTPSSGFKAFYGKTDGLYLLTSGGTERRVALSRAPTIQVFTSGTAQTYTTPSGCTMIRVRMCGGGGGAGAPDSGTSAGGTGGTTSFGSSLLSAPGGFGSPGGPGGLGGDGGGAATINSPAIGQGYPGEFGDNGSYTADSIGGSGGRSILFGGRGRGGSRGLNGGDALANSGGGGGGGGGFTALASSGGGGGATSLEAYIFGPSASYTYTVGAAGTKGSTGGSGIASGNSAAGIIIVEEFYW